MKQITVHAGSDEAFLKAIAQLNRKAAKHGLNPIVATKTGSHSEPFTYTRVIDGEADSSTFDVLVHDYELTTDIFRLSGWEYVGRVDYLSKDDTIIHTTPSFTDTVSLQRFREQSMRGVCEHCLTNRRRVNLFIVREVDTNEFKQVGASCVNDFCDGWDLKAFEFVSRIWDHLKITDGEPWMGGGGFQRSWPTVDVVAMAVASVEANGWVNAEKAEREYITRTSHIVSGNLKGDIHKSCRLYPSATQVAKAEAAIEWARVAANLEGAFDFGEKLHLVVKQPAVDATNLGIASALVPFYNNYLDKVARDAAEAARLESAEEAPVGNGLEVSGEVISVKEYYSDWGVSVKMLVLDDRGFKAWGSVPAAIDQVDRGDRVTFVANLEVGDDKYFAKFKRPRKAAIQEVK